jgi:hypothetical protein
MTDPNLPAAGWYDDGSATGTLRYWDGLQWTEHTAQAAPTSAAEPEASAHPDHAPQPEASAHPDHAGQPEAPAESFAPIEAAAHANAGGQPAGQVLTQSAPQPSSPYATTPGSSATPPAPGEKKPIHILGIIALAAAGVGFILACIPVTVVFGWILLPIAVVLSIVALFMKGRKWPAITGLAVAIVGLLVATIVSVAALIVAVRDEALRVDGFSSGSSAIEGEPGEEDLGEFTPEVFGSREEPLAIGETITTDEFEVVINSVDLNATEQVLAADEFNEPPVEGETYAIVNLTVTYTGAESSTDSMVGIDYVSADGVVKDDAYAYAWGIEPEFGMAELYNGASATSNLVLLLPADADGVLRVSPGFIDEAWVAIR